MSAVTNLFKKLVAEYGDDAVRIARGVLGMDAEPAAVEQAAKRIAQRKPAPAAPPQQAQSLAVRRTPALSAPKGVKHPVREGYSVRPALGLREGTFAVYNPDGTMHRAPTDGESDAWEMAYRAVNPDLGKYKPRGGQWLPEDANVEALLGAYSPESVAKSALMTRARGAYADGAEPDMVALRDWWERAVPKYLKNDLGTETDPLLDLADRGLLHMPDTNPDLWRRLARGVTNEDPIGGYTLPPAGGPNTSNPSAREALLAKAPWLAKQPVTDDLYSFAMTGDHNLGLGHVADELVNALNPEMSGLPSDLAIRPESFQRMSFPQAVERVGQINQWRAKRAEEEQLAAMVNNPAIHTYKEYPEAGMRWVELKNPDLPEGYALDPDTGEIVTSTGGNQGPVGGWGDPRRPQLEEALRYEGNAMGHCVGGYCDDVASGASRIFSLRDAKGQPHVTVEARPGRKVFSDVAAAVGGDVANGWLHDEGLTLAEMVARAGIPQTNDIVQIKGKQNRAPIDDYLPYVQDFVKSGTWGNVGDLGNTGLVKLPDGRYVQQGQWSQGLEKALRARNPEWQDEWVANRMQEYRTPDRYPIAGYYWDQFAPYFEGFAVGGRVDASRCFSRNPLSVR